MFLVWLKKLMLLFFEVFCFWNGMCWIVIEGNVMWGGL
ncbi:hypothetical protein SISI_0066 [Candidatus Portiera aleyrodidarum]|uniref:Uncharacterized protein n=1 Tax=Candidatus Portiera aleyrodidarum TaxID=91844 RepID=A0A6S6S0T6_9GAMM|nr:hypothetical protein SISI_0066 [Candidatus Portiera aleyrodidarum]